MAEYLANAGQTYMLFQENTGADIPPCNPLSAPEHPTYAGQPVILKGGKTCWIVLQNMRRTAWCT